MLEIIKRRSLRDATRDFVSRNLGFLGGNPIAVIGTPNEAMDEQTSLGRKMPKLFGMSGGNGDVRVEENYLYYTRRFPLNTANNTIGAGAVVADSYGYFNNGLGDSGPAAGYFSVANLTLQQTNMASGGQIPRGVGYELYDLGVSFNAAAKPADIAQCLDTMNLSYVAEQQTFQLNHGPIGMWPGGVGMYGWAATSVTATSLQGGSNGIPSLNNVRRFRSPRRISSNQKFSYNINAAAATPNANVTVALSDFVEIRLTLFGRYFGAVQG